MQAACLLTSLESGTVYVSVARARERPATRGSRQQPDDLALAHGRAHLEAQPGDRIWGPSLYFESGDSGAPQEGPPVLMR
jgi:hypothetical protein